MIFLTRQELLPYSTDWFLAISFIADDEYSAQNKNYKQGMMRDQIEDLVTTHR